MASVTIDVGLPPGVTITAYERHGDGHGFEVTWPWPGRCRCDRCQRETDARIEVKLAVAEGRDEAAARKCLGQLSAGQRRQVRAYRADMAPAFHAACRGLLPDAKAVIDRFHVAKKFNEAVDRERGKNHSGVQGQAVEGSAEGVPLPDVGVPPQPAGPVRGGEGAAGGAVPAIASPADAVRGAGAVPGDL